MNLDVLNIALSFLNSRFFPTDFITDFVVVEVQVLAQPPLERGVGRIDGIFEQCKVTVQGFHRDEGALDFLLLFPAFVILLLFPAFAILLFA